MVAENKNRLSDKIEDYFLGKWQQLIFKRKFHFATRLYLITKKNIYKEKIENLKTDFFIKWKKKIDRIKSNSSNRKEVNPDVLGEKYRKEYISKYPRISDYSTALFYWHYCKNFYQTDKRELVTDLFTINELKEAYDNLIQDKEAVAILSTRAVNFFYMLDNFLGRDELDPNKIGSISRFFETSDYDKELLRLKIYLITHSIIGSSNFYTKEISNKNIDKHLGNLRVIEKNIRDKFIDVSLDCKFEFLVCTRLLNYSSEIKKKIEEEASGSLSDEGFFLVDRLNNWKDQPKKNFNASEHRNVLYIAANSI
jgi:hypothetical protein